MTKCKDYLRQIGITEKQFALLLDKLEQEIKKELQINKMKNRGVSSRTMTTDLRLLLTLNYLRHYPTFSSLGSMFGISESYANKIFHKTVDYLLKFIRPKKTNELSLDDVCTVVIDVAEQEIERPVKKQKSYYSGKGKTHDFKMFKESKTRITPGVKILGDSGYQGIKDIHTNSHTPVKKPKDKKLTKRQKLYNHLLSKKRIVIENVIRRCKIFRITKDVYFLLKQQYICF